MEEVELHAKSATKTFALVGKPSHLRLVRIPPFSNINKDHP
jgi:hypothetical protein